MAFGRCGYVAGAGQWTEVIRGSSPAGLAGVVLMGFGRRDGIPSYVAGAEVGWVNNPSPWSQGEGLLAFSPQPSVPPHTYSYTYSLTRISWNPVRSRKCRQRTKRPRREQDTPATMLPGPAEMIAYHEGGGSILLPLRAVR